MAEEGVNGLTPLGGGPPPRRPAAVALQVLRLAHGPLRRPLPAGPASPPRGHAGRDGRGPSPASTRCSAGLEASGRWCLANRPIAQLLFWRPVPRFEPSAEAMAPSIEMVRIQRQALADAVAAGQLGPGPTPTRPSTSCRSSSAVSSAKRWPTSPTSPGAKAASAHCSPSYRRAPRPLPPTRPSPDETVEDSSSRRPFRRVVAHRTTVDTRHDVEPIRRYVARRACLGLAQMGQYAPLLSAAGEVAIISRLPKRTAHPVNVRGERVAGFEDGIPMRRFGRRGSADALQIGGSLSRH